MEKIDEPQNPEIPRNEATEVLLGRVNSDDSTMVTQSLAAAQRAPSPMDRRDAALQLRRDGGGERRRLSRSSLDCG